MMISCKRSTELICQSLDRPLSVWERAQLRFHLLMCRGCKGFMEQSQRLDELIQKHFYDLDIDQAELEAAKLSPMACERMKQKLHEGCAGIGKHDAFLPNPTARAHDSTGLSSMG